MKSKRTLGIALIVLFVGVLSAQVVAPQASNPASDVVWFCPMDKDVRGLGPANCPRCGMKLVSGLPDPVEYHLNLNITPAVPKPNESTRMVFGIHDPWKNNIVTKFTEMHEKLFHAFIVSEDLEVFVHDHPVWRDNSFQYDFRFPKPGLYRILADFYPEAATPQLLTKSVIVSGDTPAPKPLTRDYSSKTGENMTVEISTVPAEPVAGQTIQLRFHISPAEGLQKYIGAWAHMLAVSDDLIDMMHTHPVVADGGPDLRFDLLFPRARIHRVWVQFQRNGVINTVHFDIPVQDFARD